MKNVIYTIMISMMLIFSVSVFSQDPPPPPNGGNDPGSGNDPVGGGAPIAGGLEILLVLGAGYGTKKYYDFKKRKLID